MTLLQVALDMQETGAAVALARQVAASVDVIEAGTPLIKHEGIGVVRRLREAVPGKVLVADMKAMDAGALEAEMAFAAGADLMTVLAGASDATIRAAVELARAHDKQIVADLINVPDKPTRGRQLIELGVAYLGVHAGTDDQAAGANPLADLAVLRQAVSAPLIVAGGISLASLPAILALEPAIVVVGSAIANAADPVAAAAAFRAGLAVAEKRTS